MDRPFCQACSKNYAAPNYIKNGTRHWRSRCEACIRRGRGKTLPEPKWRVSGYKKKSTCDLCGFRSQYTSQITVYHIDGDLNNCNPLNLRSICLCCVEVVKRRHFTWRPGGVEPDH